MSVSALRTNLRRRSRRTYNWLYRVLMLEGGGLVARFAPTRAARWYATAVGWLLWLLPWNRQVRSGFERAFPDGPARPGHLARGWLARPFLDYVFIKAYLDGRQGFLVTEPRHEMSAATRELLDSDRSLLIAMGHMAREATTVLFQPGVVPRRLMTVVAELPRELDSHRRKRSREQFAQLLDFMVLARSDTVLSTRGSVATARELVERAREPGWAPNAHIDATPPKTSEGWFNRPFAGDSTRRFAPGIGKLARLTQLPTLLAIAYFEADGELVVNWSDPIPPPGRKERAADQPFTSALLDELELAVGRWPDQYALPIGFDRRWDPLAERWVDRSLPDGTGDGVHAAE